MRWARVSQADEFEAVSILQQVRLHSLGDSISQLSSWVRASQHNKPIFFLLALSEEGRSHRHPYLSSSRESYQTLIHSHSSFATHTPRSCTLALMHHTLVFH